MVRTLVSGYLYNCRQNGFLCTASLPKHNCTGVPTLLHAMTRMTRTRCFFKENMDKSNSVAEGNGALGTLEKEVLRLVWNEFHADPCHA